MATPHEELSPSPPSSHTKPRIVIIGAGMAGLSAAHRLVSSLSSVVVVSPENLPFELSILEGSSRMGGRIHTSSVAGSRVELGATWIHGIEGSPVYKIADRIGSLYSPSPPLASYERQDGFPIFSSTVAEGGLLVEESWIEPAIRAFNSAIDEVKGKVEIVGTKMTPPPIDGLVPASVGSFVRKLGLHALAEYESDSGRPAHEDKELGFGWDLSSLRAAVFHMQEDMERLGTASNSLFDVDLASEREYKEFPGKHITIGGGYISVLEEMAGALPRGTIQFGKKVAEVVWNRTNARPVLVMCADGSAIEADHVIVTVSLGVLKASTSAQSPVSHPDSIITNGRSVDELRGLLPNPGPSPRQLFQPPLPSWKLASISRLGFGVVNKLFLEVDPAALAMLERIFGSFVELIPRQRGDPRGSTIPPWMRKTFSICPIFKGSNVLLCWFAGEEALNMEELSDEEIVDGVVSTLMSFGLHRGSNEIARAEEEEEEESTRQRLKQSFVRVLRSKWGTNPLCKGSYTFVAAGATGMDIEALAEPVPNVKPPISSFFSPPEPPVSSDGKVSMMLSGNFPPNMSQNSLASTISSLSVASSSSSESMSSSDHEEESEDEDISQVSARGEKPLQLLFAGEATHRHYYSTTHGAFLSGVREAERILEFYHFRK